MRIKEFLTSPIQICIAIACLAVAVYFVVSTFNQLKPQTLTEKKMHCLELGSDFRARSCLILIKNE